MVKTYVALVALYAFGGLLIWQFWIGGQPLPSDDELITLLHTHRATYTQQVIAARATPSDTGSTTVYRRAMLGGQPWKSLLHSTRPPAAQITNAATDQYRVGTRDVSSRICRPVEQEWYICYDPEE